MTKKIGNEKSIENNKTKEKKNKNVEMNILEEYTKYELIKSAVNFDAYQDKALFDKNEQMSYIFLINTLKKILAEKKIILKNKKATIKRNSI